MKFSACIEWLFADESQDFANRIRLAHKAGLDAIEFWTWTNKDIDAIGAVVQETGIKVSGFVAEPMIPLTDPDNKAQFLSGLARSRAAAETLGAKVLIAQAGNDLPGRSRDEQRRSLVDCLVASADVLQGSGVRLGVEPLNTLVDHEGYFLSSTAETLEIINEVNRPEIGIVYDLYHSYVMGEKIEDVLAGQVHHVAHAHVADHPGRNEPGTGEIDLGRRLAWLFNNGYAGAVGLEYKPTAPSAAALPDVLARLDRPNS